MKKDIVHSTDLFDVVKMGSTYGIRPNHLSIVIMPYTKDSRGLPVTIGVVDEVNPMRDGGRSLTLITDLTKEEDPDVLSAAQRRLKDFTGYDASDAERWVFLGFLNTSKLESQVYPCFACDITGLESGIKQEDVDVEDKEAKEKEDNKSKFKMISVYDALDTDDCFILSLFIKMFRYIFGFAQKSGNDDKGLNDKVMNIDGVVGFGEVDGELEVATSKELSKDSLLQLNKLLSGKKFTVKITKEVKAQKDGK